MTKTTISNDNTPRFISFDEAWERVQKEIQSALSKTPSLIKHYTQYLALSRGKNIRAKSLLICALNEEEMIHENAVALAAAVEILHLATLVHDDIIDDADLRRGMPTLQKKFGKRTAVICGDYLFCKALTLAASVKNKQDYLDISLPDYISKICMGELNQHLSNGDLNLTVRKYLKIISGKTAALFEASFLAGIMLCEEDEKTNMQYRKLGRYAGMIFQLLDDCLDFESNVDIAKKPVLSDFEQGVITLPYVQAFKDNTLKQKVTTGSISKLELQDAVEAAGGLSFTKLVAKGYYIKFSRIIDELALSDFKKTKLLEISAQAFRV